MTKPQTGNEARVWMTSCPEERVLRIWGFWKRGSWGGTIVARVEYSAIGSWIWTVERRSWIFRITTDRDIRHHKIRRMLWVGSPWSELCLSPRVTMDRSQKLINRSYLKWQSLPVSYLNMYLYYCRDWQWLKFYNLIYIYIYIYMCVCVCVCVW